VAIGAHSLTILNKKGVRAEITEKYNNCKIEGFYGSTGHYVLNCPDNALHFISPTDGSETYSISLFDAIPLVLHYQEEHLPRIGKYAFLLPAQDPVFPAMENPVQQHRRNLRL
jgi:hypothetical protein